MRSNEREIRLLHLLPGIRDDTIRCATRVVSLDEDPDFETVSYVWGACLEEKTIDLAGTPIKVTQNLYAGLLRLRHEKSERVLWIDQICINQWDLEEKAAQVALMRDIYKKCTRCVTWMGEVPGDDVGVAHNAAEAVFEFLRRTATATTTPLDGLPVLFQDSEEGVAARGAFEKFSMYGNPWWSRIWTVQEAIIPPAGLLMWGHMSIDRTAVLDAARNLRDLTSLPLLPEGFATRRHTYTELLRRLLYPVHGFRHSETDNALDLLMRWRHREYTDPRDKIYALLGLISPYAIPSALSCDYTIAAHDLFAQATRDLIKHERGLRPLLGACELSHTTPNNPTWAIDFAQCNRIGKRQLKWWGHSHRYNEFAASGNNELEIDEFVESGVLSLRGVHVDQVLLTTELLRANAQESIHLDELRKPLVDCIQLAEQYRDTHNAQKTYRDGHTWDSALCRTLLGDLIMDERPLGRTASFSRARLQTDFEDLFKKLNVVLEDRIDLDFADATSASEVGLESPTYSPITPTYPQPISPCSPTSPRYSPQYSPASYTSQRYSSTSPQFTSGPSHDSSSPPTSRVTEMAPGLDSKSATTPVEVEFSLTNSSLMALHKQRPDKGAGSDDQKSDPSTELHERSDLSPPIGCAIDFHIDKDTPLERRPTSRDTTKREITAILPRHQSRSSERLQAPYSRASPIRDMTSNSPPLGTPRRTANFEDHVRTISQRSQRFSEPMYIEPDMLKNFRNWRAHRQEGAVFTDLLESLIGMMENQNFFITKSGYIGIGPPNTKTGDQIWVFSGGNVPFVMREVDGRKAACPQLTLIGDAYVHGIMDGEAVEDEPNMQPVHVF